jgi:hypothetical protein
MSATVHGKKKDKRLVMVVDGDVRRQFVKLKGPSVFPPVVKCPPLNPQ